jgi:c-di-GMP-binding flagellar brake protein YcgR
MSRYRRREKRIGFESAAVVGCQIVHPQDRSATLRGQLLDLGAGGIGLRIPKQEVPAWVTERPVIVRADLPGTGQLLRRTARMRNQRRGGAAPEFGFAWDARDAASLAYERVQSRRLQRFIVACDREASGRVDLRSLAPDGMSEELAPRERGAGDLVIVRLERMLAAFI